MFVITWLNKVSDLINKICLGLSVTLLGATIVITTAQIIFRVFFTSLTWTEEATRYCLVWCTMLGAGCVYKSGANIAVTFVQDVVPKAVKRYMKVLVHLLCFTFFVIILVYGVRYMTLMGAQTSAALIIPMKYMYMSIPIGSGIMGLHAFLAIFEELLHKKGGRV